MMDNLAEKVDKSAAVNQGCYGAQKLSFNTQ